MERLIVLGYLVIPAAAVIASFAFSGDAASSGGDGIELGLPPARSAALAAHDVVLAVVRDEAALVRDEPRAMTSVRVSRHSYR